MKTNMNQMTKISLLSLTILLAHCDTFAQRLSDKLNSASSSIQTSKENLNPQLGCKLGIIHDKSAVTAVLKKVIKNNQVQIDEKSGTLRLSVSPVDVIRLNDDSTISRVTVTRSYNGFYDVYGPLQ